jgi:outer membrane protein assembly factor BamB
MSSSAKLDRHGLLTKVETLVTVLAPVTSAAKAPRCRVSYRGFGTRVGRVAAGFATTAGVLRLGHSVSNGAGPSSRSKPVTRLLRLRRVAFAPLLALISLLVASPAVPAVGSRNVSRAATSAAGPAPGELWPTFGHDPAHSGLSSDTAISASTASGLGKRWSASLTGASARAPSPVVAYSGKLSKTVVYTATFGGVVSAFNAATGKLVWKRSVGSQVEASPAFYRGNVYVGGLNGTLHALDAATGAVRCTFTMPPMAPATKPGELVSSPVVGRVDGTGTTVFIGDAGLHVTGSPDDSANGGAFWAVTGVGNRAGGCRKKWAYDKWTNKGTNGTQTGVWDEPALVKNASSRWEVVLGTSNPDQSVYALDAVNGSRLWRFHTQSRGPDEDIGAGPTIGPPGANGFADGVVYIDGKDGIEYALNLRTGKQIWSFILGPGSDAAKGVSEAALTGNTLMVCYATSVFALNATTGAVIWNTSLPGRGIQASPAVSGPPGDQVAFIGDNDGTEYGLNVQNGAQVFTNATSGTLTASAAVANGMLYFTNGGTFYAYAPS